MTYIFIDFHYRIDGIEIYSSKQVVSRSRVCVNIWPISCVFFNNFRYFNSLILFDFNSTINIYLRDIVSKFNFRIWILKHAIYNKLINIAVVLELSHIWSPNRKKTSMRSINIQRYTYKEKLDVNIELVENILYFRGLHREEKV